MSTSDPRLEALRSLSPAAAREELGRLLLEDASPAAWRVIRAQLGELPPAEQEEIHGTALLALTERLQGWLEGELDDEIANLSAYAAATALNACRAHLRRRYPERTRLDNQLRYLLRHLEGLAIWDGPGGSWCGLVRWQGRERESGSVSARPIDPFLATLGRSPAGVELPDLLRRLLLWSGGAWRFRDLVATVAELRGVRDLPPLSLGAGGDDGEAPLDLPEERPGAEEQLADRQYLLLLWSEIRELPRGQRVALLLNLRDGRGGDLLSLLPISGIAALGQIAASLEIPAEGLRDLWPRLPLEDQEIAELLGLNRRQVINLRKSARERLGRRMRRHAGPSERR